MVYSYFRQWHSGVFLLNSTVLTGIRYQRNFAVMEKMTGDGSDELEADCGSE